MDTTQYYAEIDSPLGKMLLIAEGDLLTGLYFYKTSNGFGRLPEGEEVSPDDITIFRETSHQLQQYFEGRLRVFDIPVKFEGTDFQKRVWNELFTIPYGETVSYLDIAKRINNPGAVRAVGLTNGKNPISIIYPCHRVIGSNGKLTGYGGGIDRKEWLLYHEGALRKAPQQTSLFDN